MGKAIRRHHLQRMKQKARRVGNERGLPGNYDKLYNHLAHCSGPCCGNPRRWFGEKTMQERRAI